MAKMIRIRCNGPRQCENQIDLEELVLGQTAEVYRLAHRQQATRLRARYVRPCQHCSEGRVIVTREVAEKELFGR